MKHANTSVFGQADQVRGARFLDVSDSIGRQLVRDAIWADGRCNWLIWTKEPVGGAFCSVHKAASLDLYQGGAGIALFLAHLVVLTRDSHQRETVAGAARQLDHQLTHAQCPSFGLYSGSIGAACALAVIGRAIGDEEWEQKGLAAADRLAGAAVPADQFDLTSGCAGAIIALVRTAREFEQPNLIAHARRFAAVLLAGAERNEFGISWPAHAGETRNLLGLSHGTTGIALAFLELHQIRPDARYVEAALGAIDYERRLFDPAQNNWPDFPTLPCVAQARPGFPIAWCHGSTGMGLARLRMLDLLPTDQHLLPEIDAALSNAVRALNAPVTPMTADFSLCHGACGNSEFLLQLGHRLGRPDAIAAAQSAGDLGIELFHSPKMPWACGVPDCGETAGLMTGTAGIGMHYLRLFDPVAAPCVLLGDLTPARRVSTEPLLSGSEPNRRFIGSRYHGTQS
jgi:lantibiotic biosynthesis protein